MERAGLSDSRLASRHWRRAADVDAVVAPLRHYHGHVTPIVGLDGGELANGLGVPMLATLPIDPLISELGDMGKIEDYQNPRVKRRQGKFRVCEQNPVAT